MSNAAYALFGSQGECKIESLESDKKFCTAMFNNGIWEKRITHIGKFVHCVSPISIPYLQTTCQPSFELSLPKLPVGIYNEILRFFRDIYNNIKSEVYVGVFWNLATLDYELYVPEQQVAGASISYKRNEGSFVDTNLVHVMDVHSHANFGAGFSGTDTADEISTKLFGVIGNVISNVSMAWRAGCNQKFVTLTFDDIFDRTSDKTYSIPDSVKSKITEFKRVVQQYQAPARPLRYPVARPHKADSSYKDYESSLYQYYLNAYKDPDMPYDSGEILWNKPDFKEAAEDFYSALKAWIEDANYGVAEGVNHRTFIAAFFDLINEFSYLDINFMKGIVNEIGQFTTIDEYNQIIEHMGGNI